MSSKELEWSQLFSTDGKYNEIVANVLHVQKLAKNLFSEIRIWQVGRVQCALCRGDYPQQ